jgi:hypothetical protein
LRQIQIEWAVKRVCGRWAVATNMDDGRRNVANELAGLLKGRVFSFTL